MTDDINNLDIDLTGVDVARPLLPAQTKRCTIGEVTVERREGRNGELRELVIPLTLEEPATSTTGKTVSPGFQHTDRILIDPTGGLTQEMINQKLARLQVAALKLDAPQKFNAGELTGKQVLVTFDTRADRNDPTQLFQDCKRYARVP